VKLPLSLPYNSEAKNEYSYTSTPPVCLNTLNTELNPICYLLALFAHHFLHVSRIRVNGVDSNQFTFITVNKSEDEPNDRNTV
jgi:hypothetical protein